jgi:hypothetical protein
MGAGTSFGDAGCLDYVACAHCGQPRHHRLANQRVVVDHHGGEPACGIRSGGGSALGEC